jgi:hypothetical protein
MKIYLGEYTEVSQTITKYRIDTNFTLKWEMLASFCLLIISGFKLILVRRDNSPDYVLVEKAFHGII